MFKLKRLIAKVIDNIIINIINIIIMTPIMYIYITINKIDIYKFSDFNEVEKLITSLNVNQLSYLVCFTSLITIISTIIYLLVFFKITNGSLGKLFLQLKVKNIENNTSSLMRVIKREPLIQINLLTIIFSLIGIIFNTPFSSFNFLSSYFIVMMFFNRDFWSKYTIVVQGD